MVRQLKNLMGMGVLILAILGCQPSTPATQAAPPVDNGAALTLTSLVLTLTAPPATPTPVVVVAESVTLPPEGFPTATELPPTVEAAQVPVTAPTLTVAPVPSVPMVSVTVGTNCRSGPGREYEILGVAPVGMKFLLLGRNSQTNYWIIRLPNSPDCWLWGEHAVVEGDVASLPEYAIPAPPPPQYGSIQGVIQVRDALGVTVRLSGIKVIVQPSGLSTEADENGNYGLGGVPVGEILVRFSHPNVVAADIPNIIVQAGQPTMVATAVGVYVIPGPPPPTPCRFAPFCVPLPTIGPAHQ